MAQYQLSDEQWCVLDLLARTKQNGLDWANRMELLRSSSIPQHAAVKLTWAALTIPKALVEWRGQHNFRITDEGLQVFNLRFGKDAKPAIPTHIADAVICLPDHSQRLN